LWIQKSSSICVHLLRINYRRQGEGLKKKKRLGGSEWDPSPDELSAGATILGLTSGTPCASEKTGGRKLIGARDLGREKEKKKVPTRGMVSKGHAPTLW